MAELNTEQKIRINLSRNARSVLQNDREQFAPSLTANGFLNDLIERCIPVLDASIADALLRRRDEITGVLEKQGFPEKTILKVTGALLDSYEEKLTEKASSWPKGDSCTFRLNNRNTELLYSDDWPDLIFYEDKPVRYLKALIEEYASHSPYEREGIYYHEWIALIDQAVRSQTLVRLSMINVKNQKLEWDMRVYGVLPNDANLFHYIVGMAVQKGGLKSQESILPVRLSRLKSIRLITSSHARSGSLSKSERQKIEDRTGDRDVQFLLGHREDCVVDLNEDGRRYFRRTQYMKPPLKQIDREGRYHFDCSAEQLFQYFYKFGDRADVIAPESVRKRLREEYRRASEKYS